MEILLCGPRHIQRQKPQHNRIVKAEKDIETKTLSNSEGCSQRQKEKKRCRMKHKDKMDDKGKRPRLIQRRFTTTNTNDTVTGKGIIAHGENVMW